MVMTQWRGTRGHQTPVQQQCGDLDKKMWKVQWFIDECGLRPKVQEKSGKFRCLWVAALNVLLKYSYSQWNDNGEQKLPQHVLGF